MILFTGKYLGKMSNTTYEAKLKQILLQEPDNLAPKLKLLASQHTAKSPAAGLSLDLSSLHQ